MNAIDLLEETKQALAANRARSFLTILGIVIGIASVIAMVSIGEGAQSSIQSSIEGLGSNLLTIIPGVIQPGRGVISSGRGAAQTLKPEDVDSIRAIQGVAATSPEVSRRFQVSSTRGTNTNVTVIGIIPEYATVKNVAVDTGSFITDTHVRSLGRVALLGPTTARDLFGDADPVGQTIHINQSNVHVIGVLHPKGGSGFFDPDNTVFVPLTTMQKLLAGVDYYSTIEIAVDSKDDMPRVEQELTDALSAKHRVDPAAPDFSIVSQADILGALGTVVQTFTIFLASVAGISLVVGGIGIMNMMLTNVTERTREIGLRKAIGATRADINRQFLMEAVTLTLVGGVIGMVLGWLVSTAVSRLSSVPSRVSLFSVLLAFGISTLIGVVFGYYPARRASELNPIEALRHE